MQDAEQPQAPEHTPELETRTKSGARIQPLLREVAPGEAASDAQGLDWYRTSLLEDADGDCATEFLEEPRKDTPDADAGPAAKKPHRATLQASSTKASPARVASLRVHRGHVEASGELPNIPR